MPFEETLRCSCEKIKGQVEKWRYLKKNQTTPRPSEHPPVMGEKMSILLCEVPLNKDRER